jgi:hypothetical protein
MIEKVGHIRNPLTIVAIFASVAEVSGTVVLPFVSENSQSVYVWFLMFFPVFLVTVFFVTLNFNHKVLYAPSDFRDDRTFLDLFRAAKPHEKYEKLSQEIRETEVPDTGSRGAGGGGSEGRQPTRRVDERNLRAKYLLAEELVLNKLSAELGVPIQRGVTLGFGRGYIFDGAAVIGDRFVAIEVKYLRSGAVLQRIEDTINKINSIFGSMSVDQLSRFSLVLAMVLDRNAVISPEIVKERLLAMTRGSDLHTDVKVYQFDELEKESAGSTFDS